MKFSKAEMCNMIYVLGECERNCLLASRVYAAKFPNSRHPNRRSFQSLRARFEEEGSIKYKKSTQRKTVVTEENSLEVLQSVIENPYASTRDLERTLNISRCSINRILRLHKFHPYGIMLLQKLSENDKLNRLAFCTWVMEENQEREESIRNILVTDEATFHSNGFVNRHNFHYYDRGNPHLMRAIDHQHRWSLNVWAGIVNNTIIGPFFFEESVNGVNYLRFLRGPLEEYLDDLNLDILRNLWFQQDGAPAHYSAPVRNYLDQRFPNRWIGRLGPIAWPPRSPDLSKLDFFLWGVIKEEVYKTPVTTMEDMQERIRASIETIKTKDMLNNVHDSFLKRVQICIEENGGHFEHKIKYN